VIFPSPDTALSSVLFMDGFGTSQFFLLAGQKKRCVYVGFLNVLVLIASGVDLCGPTRAGKDWTASKPQLEVWWKF